MKKVGFFGMLNRNSQVVSNRKHNKMFKAERMYYFMICRHYRPEAISSSNKTQRLFISLPHDLPLTMPLNSWLLTMVGRCQSAAPRLCLFNFKVNDT